MKSNITRNSVFMLIITSWVKKNKRYDPFFNHVFLSFCLSWSLIGFILLLYIFWYKHILDSVDSLFNLNQWQYKLKQFCNRTQILLSYFHGSILWRISCKYANSWLFFLQVSLQVAGLFLPCYVIARSCYIRRRQVCFEYDKWNFMHIK